MNNDSSTVYAVVREYSKEHTANMRRMGNRGGIMHQDGKINITTFSVSEKEMAEQFHKLIFEKLCLHSCSLIEIKREGDKCLTTVLSVLISSTY